YSKFLVSSPKVKIKNQKTETYRLTDYTKALYPVILRPTMREFISLVPSYEYMASASAKKRATLYSNKIPLPPITSRARDTISRVRIVQNTLASEACSSFNLPSS